ncbi:MAG: PilZ domain-containing protein, partial [Deltaproteobacteria bacterium]|nr:PilZ domain-containing protein [Deltaproteobacteria bacterium]
TYNVNLNGLFVRTIAPPPLQSIVECRFRPPCGDGEVALPAQVVWRKEFAAAGKVLSPAGIGLQFLDGAKPADHAGYEAGYQALLAATKPDDN